MTRILGLDLGTTTGWALDDAGVIVSGAFDLKPKRYEGGGMRFVRFVCNLDEFHRNGQLTQIYFEEVRRHIGVDAAHAYGGFLAHLLAWCETHNVPCAGIPVGTIKKHATGKGNASKEMMIEAAQKQFARAVADDNEADALWVLDCGKAGKA